MIETLNMIIPQSPQIEFMSIDPKDDMEHHREKLINQIEKLDQGKGVLVLTDLFGGTPSNLSISIMALKNIEVIAGVNLPMLIKLASLKHDITLNQAALEIEEAGKKYIQVASNFLGSTQNHAQSQ